MNSKLIDIKDTNIKQIKKNEKNENVDIVDLILSEKNINIDKNFIDEILKYKSNINHLVELITIYR